MSRSRLVRAIALCLVLSLAAQAAWAGPQRSGETSGSAWAFFTQLWHSVTASWSDVGCILDPYGACGSAHAPAPPPETEVGCIIDPNGGCGDAQAPAPPPLSDVGCILDPNGGCGAGG